MQEFAHKFTQKHGLAIRALGISVGDAKEAYEVSVANGGVGVLSPKTLTDAASGKSLVVSEVKLYGDVVIRWVSGDFDGPYMPGYEAVESGPDVRCASSSSSSCLPLDAWSTRLTLAACLCTSVRPPLQLSIGIQRFDHCVGNVPKLIEAVEYVMGFTGFHEFSEFTAEDVGTVDSGLNSMVLASNNEMVLIPVNEPTFGTPRKSQIQTYLEQNVGPGLQHMALKTDDIFHTLAEMRKRSYLGGFEFMPRPEKGYYERLPARIGNDLSEKQYKQIEELGLLVDKDDQGILLQIFTKPLGDRPTVFFEIIERVGCMLDISGRLEQAAGCGGFGKGNFSELFKSIEEYEKTLNV